MDPKKLLELKNKLKKDRGEAYEKMRSIRNKKKKRKKKKDD